MLRVEDLHVSYRSVAAVRGVSLDVPDGAIVGLVGANGAGKTSTLNAITGLVARRGKTSFNGQDISRLSTAEIVRRGVVQVAQGRQLFPDMTVLENLEMGGFLQPSTRLQEQLGKVFAQFSVLKERAAQRAGTLSGGEQQMLAVGRALMLRPRLMLLDEPSFGLAPLIVRDLFKILGKINREDKVTILVVEQNAQLALELADKAYVIETGRIVMSGSAGEIANNEDVRKSYLGY
ncbi:MAG TPA: ABC transporter ATP-binding protein [Xanthobacteraceae bacterium]|nr:ABC transporter ATP-binding protein [Xanthobacteraceae bacterium]